MKRKENGNREGLCSQPQHVTSRKEYINVLLKFIVTFILENTLPETEIFKSLYFLHPGMPSAGNS